MTRRSTGRHSPTHQPSLSTFACFILSKAKDWNYWEPSRVRGLKSGRGTVGEVPLQKKPPLPYLNAKTTPGGYSVHVITGDPFRLYLYTPGVAGKVR